MDVLLEDLALNMVGGSLSALFDKAAREKWRKIRIEKRYNPDKKPPFLFLAINGQEVDLPLLPRHCFGLIEEICEVLVTLPFSAHLQKPRKKDAWVRIEFDNLENSFSRIAANIPTCVGTAKAIRQKKSPVS